MIFAPVRRRLLMLNVLVMVVVVAALGVGVVLLTDHLLIAQESAALRAEADHSRIELQELREGDFRASHRGWASGTFYLLWTAAGRPIFNPAEVPTGPLRPAALAARAGPPRTRVETVAGQEVLVVSEPYRTPRGGAAVLQVGRGLSPVETVEREAVLAVALACLCALVLGLAGSWFLVESALVPIRQAFDRQRQFTADASHELRTPLSVLDASVQLIRRHPERTVEQNRDLLDGVSAELRRMGRLVSSLLDLARADTAQADLRPVDCDLDDVLRTTLRDLAPIAATAGVGLELKADAGRAQVDPDRLRQLLLILLDNAIRHSAAGQKVEVRCTRASRHIDLQVSDRGPGIPPAERERVFQRFYRLDPGPGSTGSGLGLAIAKWIVTAHGGNIRLADNRPGLRVLVRIPIWGPGRRRRPAMPGNRLLRRLHPG